MMSQFSAWFAERSLREKWMLIAMMALLALTILWYGIIRPVGDGLSAARERHGDAVIRLAETQMRVREIEALEHDRPAPITASLESVIRERANEAGFALASVVPQGRDRVQITIATARPGPLFGWIAGLEAAGILVDTLGTTDNGDKTVSAQVILKARGK